MGDKDEPAGKPFPGYDFDTFDGCVTAMSDEVDDPEAFCNWLEEEGKDALSDPEAQEVLSTIEVEFVSPVDTPAQDSEWLIAKNAEGPDGKTHRWQSEATLYVSKSESEKDEDVKQVAFAPVLIPKEADKQGDVIPMPAIEDAAHMYLSEYRKVDSDHDLRDGKGTPVESWTLKQDTTFEMPDGAESREYPAGTWVMGIKFSDETWDRVVSGDLNGLSIYGGAKPVDVDALLGKGDGRTNKSEADDADEPTDGGADSSDHDNQNMSDGDDPGDSGTGGEETTTKQELNAEGVSAMLSKFGSMVEDGSVSRDATVEDFVRGLIDDGAVDEGEVKGLSVFLGDDGDGDESEADEADDGEDDGDDGGIDMSDDDTGDGDVDKSGDDGDGDDVSKSTGADFEDAPDWGRALKSEIDDLREKVEDPPDADKMEPGDELSDRIVKNITGHDDAEVARKALREQVEKASDGDDLNVDYDGVTDDENADSEATGAAHSASANTRMAGGDN